MKEGVIVQEMDNKWYLVEVEGKYYVSQNCPSVEFKLGEKVDVFILEDGICEVIE